ncbi:MAG: lytic transglycosylase domain-containing protein [Treponema sp.]|jgi:soluble lytic murein transglycosylase|nr:lytic transglycosylase domain-containing protein [Treponema sp.]
MTQVLGIPRDEAAQLLRKGDTGFIRQAELSLEPGSPGIDKTISRLKELEAIHPGAPFYAGLLVNESEVSNGGGNSGENKVSDGNKDTRLETLLFCAALESSSLPVRREAALKLLPRVLQNNSPNEANYILGVLDSGGLKSELLPLLRAACFYRLGRYGEAAGASAESVVNPAPANPAEGDPVADWGKAIAFFSAWKTPAGEPLRSEIRREVTPFLFGMASSELRDWAFTEALSSSGLLDAAESAALLGRRAGANYAVTLNYMRPSLADGGIVFFSYPSLISDLGRAYQYTPALRAEGAELFRSWAAAEADYPPEARYLILFFAGRIERAMGNYEASSDYFRRALEHAPDDLQSDACIWYMLMNALAESPAAAASLVKTSISRWSDLAYFDDVLDRLSNYFTGRRQWNDILEIYFGLENRGPSASLAQYAWIVGRAIEEGYIRSFYRPEFFFRTAFETENASFYYRAMAATKLGLTLIPTDESVSQGAAVTARSDITDFLLGFFECGAASFALPYIQAAERRLSVPELREIAAALAASGRHKESLDLVSRYIDMEAPPASREDLLLYYPQPFKETVERFAGEAGLSPEILYALIRTESYFKPDIVSSSGAIGLVQLMPATAAEMADRIARSGGPNYRAAGLDLKDPEVSIHIGSYYLAYLNAQMGTPMLALLAYNGGMGRVRNWLAADRRQGGLPEDIFLETIEYTETREYGRKVLSAAAIYGYLHYGKGMEEVAAGVLGE